VNKLRILPVTAVNDTTEDEGRETIQNNALNWNTSSVSLIPHVFTWRGGRGTWIPSPPTVAVPLLIAAPLVESWRRPHYKWVGMTRSVGWVQVSVPFIVWTNCCCIMW